MPTGTASNVSVMFGEITAPPPTPTTTNGRKGGQAEQPTGPGEPAGLRPHQRQQDAEHRADRGGSPTVAPNTSNAFPRFAPRKVLDQQAGGDQQLRGRRRPTRARLS